MDFKVRCLMTLLNGITKGKIYEIQNGYFHYDDGSKAGPYKNFKELEQHFSSKFELVTDKPRICDILGVEDEQDFIFYKKHYIITVGADKEERIYLNDGVGDHFDAYVICDMINHPEKIIRQPQFSEEQIGLMKMCADNGYSIWYVEDTILLHVREPDEEHGPFIPKFLLPQIDKGNSPFNAAEYLEGLK